MVIFRLRGHCKSGDECRGREEGSGPPEPGDGEDAAGDTNRKKTIFHYFFITYYDIDIVIILYIGARFFALISR